MFQLSALINDPKVSFDTIAVGEGFTWVDNDSVTLLYIKHSNTSAVCLNKAIDPFCSSSLTVSTFNENIFVTPVINGVITYLPKP